MSEDAPEKIAAKVMAIDIKITVEYEKVKDEPQKALEVLSKRLKYSQTLESSQHSQSMIVYCSVM